MSAKAVRHAESFGWDVTAERTLAVYEQAVAAFAEGDPS
jgi:D-inositol-3-phosphate glycosyltransferase